MSVLAPLHGGYVGPGAPWLVAVIALAGVGTAVLLGLAVGAFVRRGSRPYLLIVGALAALLSRSAIAGITMTGTISAAEHHALEHGLDVVFVALVIGAVYYARTAVPAADPRP